MMRTARPAGLNPSAKVTPTLLRAFLRTGPMYLRIVAWRSAGHASERTGEMTLVAETECRRDRGNLHVGLDQHLLRPGDAQPERVLHRALAHTQPEHSGEVKAADAGGRGDVGQGEAFADMTFQEGVHPKNGVRDNFRR